MAHPKRKISKTRRDKRRTHYKASDKQISICSTTGEAHLYHRAHWHEGKLYYRGKILIDAVEYKQPCSVCISFFIIIILIASKNYYLHLELCS